MSKYYFVGTLLPDLKIGVAPEISFQELDQLLRLNLSEPDYAKTIVLRRYWDLENFRSYWQHEPFDPRGNLDDNQIEAAILEQEDFPPYMRDFFESHETKEERLSHFPQLLAGYFKQEAAEATGFLKDLLQLQREMRLVLVAFRAKKLGRDLRAELQFEDPEDPFLVELLAYGDAPVFEPPEKYKQLQYIFEEHADTPLVLHQALCDYIFDAIDNRVGLQPFSMDRILGYMFQLSLVEKWLELDKQKGVEIVDRFVKEKT